MVNTVLFPSALIGKGKVSLLASCTILKYELQAIQFILMCIGLEAVHLHYHVTVQFC